MTQDYASHLGDGAYVALRHGSVVLTANSHLEHEASDIIHLDPQTMERLIQWWEMVKHDHELKTKNDG
jgi:uncharacterized protein (DUF2345 family)